MTLRLAELGKELEIEIRDDGVGFDPQAVQPGHYGLLGMRERAPAGGGRLDIQSEAGKGTCSDPFPLEIRSPDWRQSCAWRNCMSPIRILVADDHLIIRQGLRLILETQEGFEMVGEAADGAEAVRLCAELHPDVVLMDLRMPGMDGLTRHRTLADRTAGDCRGDPDHLQRG